MKDNPKKIVVSIDVSDAVSEFSHMAILKLEEKIEGDYQREQITV